MRYTLLIQMALIFASVHVADMIDIATRLGTPDLLRPHLRYGDLQTVVAIYLLSQGAIAAIERLARRRVEPLSPRSWVIESAISLASLSLATFVIFRTALLPFAPVFHASAITLIALGYAMIIVIVWVVSRRRGHTGQPANELPEAASERPSWRVALSVGVIASCVSPWTLAASMSTELLFRARETPAPVVPTIMLEAPPTSWRLVDIVPALRFEEPVDIAFTPRQPDTMYVLCLDGQIYRADFDGNKQLLLDFSEEFTPLAEVLGAMGFALHPRFGEPDAPQRGYVYVLFGSNEQDSQFTKLTRFDLALPDPASRAASMTDLIVLERPGNPLHTGGSVLFGPDGMLYFSTGDFGAYWSQRLDRTLSGGVFRIDVDQRGGDVSAPIRRQPKDGRTQGYYIPLDNPFYGRADTLEEFYVLGLRQAFRMSLDSATGDIWVGDVGEDHYEEIIRLSPGDNAQWPAMEGNVPGRLPSTDTSTGTPAPPLYAYAHSPLGTSIVGGFVYRGDRHPSLKGKYIFGDYVSSLISSLDPSTEPPTVKTLSAAHEQIRAGIVTIKPGLDGEIVVLLKGATGKPWGRIKKLVRAEQGEPAVSPTGDEALTPAQVANNKYTLICARCHGTDGRGVPSLTVGLDPRPDFTSTAWQRSVTDEQLRRTILEGGLVVGKSKDMPPWKGFFTDSELDAVMKKIRAFEKEADSDGSAPVR